MELGRVYDCDQLRCSKLCQTVIPPEDALELLCEAVPSSQVFFSCLVFVYAASTVILGARTRRQVSRCRQSLELRCYLAVDFLFLSSCFDLFFWQRLVYDLRFEPVKDVTIANSPSGQIFVTNCQWFVLCLINIEYLFFFAAVSVQPLSVVDKDEIKHSLENKEIKEVKVHRFNAANVGTDACCFALDLYWILKMAAETSERGLKVDLIHYNVLFYFFIYTAGIFNFGRKASLPMRT